MQNYEYLLIKLNEFRFYPFGMAFLTGKPLILYKNLFLIFYHVNGGGKVLKKRKNIAFKINFFELNYYCTFLCIFFILI